MDETATLERPERSAGDRTENFGFLLMPEFPIYAFILATEALRRRQPERQSSFFPRT